MLKKSRKEHSKVIFGDGIRLFTNKIISITLNERGIKEEGNSLYVGDDNPETNFNRGERLSPRERNEYRFGRKMQDKINEFKEEFGEEDIGINIEFVLEKEDDYIADGSETTF